MQSRDLSRRGLLTRSCAALMGVLSAPLSFAAADPPRLDHQKLSAAAAGSLWIGGDLQVNRLGFGAMRITGDGVWGEPRDVAQARAVLRRAVDLGTNFIDTADAYGPYVSERLIKEALHPYPRGLVIATKGGYVRPGPNQWVADGRPAHLREACEGSLRRLQVERIDLYQMHRPDPKVPYEESIGELARLQQEGKVRHVGVSNVTAAELAKARALVKVASVQNEYNVSQRDSDEVLAICEREHIAFLPWSPLARYAQHRFFPDHHFAMLRSLAAEHHIEASQAALAWLLARSSVMLPIPGTSRVDHLEMNVAAATIRFSRSEMQRVG